MNPVHNCTANYDWDSIVMTSLNPYTSGSVSVASLQRKSLNMCKDTSLKFKNQFLPIILIKVFINTFNILCIGSIVYSQKLA